MVPSPPLWAVLGDVLLCLGAGLLLGAVRDGATLAFGSGPVRCFVWDVLAFAAAAFVCCGFAAGASATGAARWYMAAAMGLDKWVTEESIIHKMVKAGYPDKCFLVTDEEARAMANRLCQEEGIFCGMSSGANVLIALEIAKRLGPGKNVVTTIVDRRDRYLCEMPNEKYVV